MLDDPGLLSGNKKTKKPPGNARRFGKKKTAQTQTCLWTVARGFAGYFGQLASSFSSKNATHSSNSAIPKSLLFISQISSAMLGAPGSLSGNEKTKKPPRNARRFGKEKRQTQTWLRNPTDWRLSRHCLLCAIFFCPLFHELLFSFY